MLHLKNMNLKFFLILIELGIYVVLPYFLVKNIWKNYLWETILVASYICFLYYFPIFSNDVHEYFFPSDIREWCGTARIGFYLFRYIFLSSISIGALIFFYKKNKINIKY